METDNPYDIVDAFNVLVNIPEFDENLNRANDDDHERELVRDPFKHNINEKMKPV